MATKTSVEKMANSIGFDIGMSDDLVQADLLNGFSTALVNSIGLRDIGKQLTYVVDRLEPKAEEVILELAEFIKMKRGEKV